MKLPFVPRGPRGVLLLAFVAVVVVALVVVRYAPFYLPPPAETALPLPDGAQAVFGYATLTNPLVRFVVVGRPVPSEPARLEGWRREGRDLVADPDAAVDGRLFTVDPAGLQRLDRFEETDLRYERFLVLLDDDREAWVYRLLPLPPELP